ncbi:MAG: hypothetical protein PVG32_19955 [Anaerolineales bacterium]|jgi:hypothetical protein
MEPKEPNISPDRSSALQSARNYLFTIAYWLIAIGILSLIVFAALRFSQPALAPTSTSLPTSTITHLPSDLPSPTPTLIPTLSATPTLPPTSTPSQTPSPTISPTATNTPFPPSLTPATPISERNAYILTDWNPSDASDAIARLQSYPLILYPEVQNTKDFYATYEYATLAQSEAILRFPNHSNSDAWRWDLAYNLARTGDSRAGAYYADLLNRTLNEGTVRSESLVSWIENQELRLNAEIITSESGEGQLNGQIVHLSALGGSAYLWITEADNQFSVFPLSSDFDFPNQLHTAHFWSDLTGDGTNDFIVTYPNWHGRLIRFPRLFNLAPTTPRELLFKPSLRFEVGLEHEYTWSTIEHPDGEENLHFSAVVFPPCPVTIDRRYQWSGTWFELSEVIYTVQPATSLLNYCSLIVDQAATVWGSEAAIQIMETLLPDWPPPKDTGNQAYPSEALDEWRFRLGVYHKLSGNDQQAASYFRSISEQPIVPSSRWIAPAEQFLANLDTPKDFYHVCKNSEYCDPRIAFQHWVASLPAEQMQDPLYYLRQDGVDIRITDVFDFQGDEQPERWFTFRHTLQDKLEFWVLTQTSGDLQALFVDTVETNKPTLTRYTTPQRSVIVWLGSQQSFSLENIPGTEEHYINLYQPSYFYADFTNQVIDESLLSLFTGVDPASVRDNLLDLRYSNDFACLNDVDCARFLYALGLAYELAGDSQDAVNTYVEIWSEYPKTAFTILARLKLRPNPTFVAPPTLTYTPTLSPTITRTPTITPTPTITSTPTPTSTSTPEGTPPPTDTTTPTPTSEETLQPTYTTTSTS